MITDDLRQRRLALIREHMDTEVTQEFDATLATFNGHPHYEIMATGQTYDGDDEVMGYYRRRAPPSPTNAMTTPASTSQMTRLSSNSTCWERISGSSTACHPRARHSGYR